MLVKVDGKDEHDSDANLLPEGLNTDDYKSVLKDCGNEHSHDGTEDGSDPSQKACTADQDSSDRLQRIEIMAVDRGA